MSSTLDIAMGTLIEMSNAIDSQTFAGRLLAAATHARVPFKPQALADAVGLKRRQNVDSWMKGSVPRADVLYQIADALGVDARWLATGQGEMLTPRTAMPVRIEEGEAITRLRRASPEWRSYVLSLAMNEKHDQQRLFISMLNEHVPDKAVMEAYYAPGAHPREKKHA